MTTLTNEQMFKKVITTIKKMDISEDDDFDTEMHNIIEKVKKSKPTKKTKEAKKTKETKETMVLTAYQQFVKDKMPEVKDLYDDNKDRMRAIAKLWKEQKDSSSE